MMLKKTIFVLLTAFLQILFSGILFSQGNSNIDSLRERLINSRVDEKIDIYIDLMHYYNRLKPDSSIIYGDEALSLARASGNKKGEATILYLLGVSYHAQSIYSKALEYYELSLELRKKINDKVGVGESLNRIGMIHNVRGEYEKALEYCLKSITILENENDKKALGRSYNHLGILYYILNDLKKAKENSFRALHFNETVDDDLILAVSHEHLGIIYIKTKEYDKALYHVKKSLELRLNKNDRVGSAGSFENLAVISRNMKKFDEALVYYNKSLELKKLINNQRGVASSISGIGLTYQNMGDYEKSILYLNEALEMRKKLGDKRGVASSFTRLSEAFESKGDFKTSLGYYKKAKTLNDSLLNEQKNKAVAEAQAAYKHEVQEKEILLLQKENTIQRYLQAFLLVVSLLLAAAAIAIAKAYRSKRKINDLLVTNNQQITEQKEELQRLNDQLKEAIATKDKFFSIIAHDLKSPYQGLLGYSQILSTEYTTLTETEKITFIKSIEELSQNSFRLLENLLEWSRLQTGKVNFLPESLNLLLELYPTLTLLKQTAQNKQIELEYDIDKSIFVQADKNMLTTIVRNLVSNSIKFTYPGGKIFVTAAVKADLVEVSVSDTGIGMKKETVDNLFNVEKSISTKGTASEEGTGLGLSLCKEMITLHNGEIWIESEVGKGTTFHFTLMKK